MAFVIGRVGSLLLTRGVNDAVADSSSFADFVLRSLSRFHNGDWGTVCKEDWQANNDSLNDGSRIIGAYEHKGMPKIWIIAEAKNDNDVREAVTVLFPEEY